ncbi:MAG: YajG family lipoprotein [Enterobacterales bacterium]|nr:YajG family lipoprotein [Enterobacterales bacterium]
MFDSSLMAKTAIKLVVHKQGQQWAKIYKVSRVQTVANPATDTDATGIMNQALTEQFQLFFNDPSLIDFSTNSR